jgi:acyl-CoA thioester hydrolase
VDGFDWPVRVYYEDTDAGGVVYHTSYIRYFERARTEWLRSLGYSQLRLIEEEKLLFSVVKLEIRFALPAKLDDLLTVRTRTGAHSGVRLDFDQAVMRDADGATLAQGNVTVACLDALTMRPRRMPTALREALV